MEGKAPLDPLTGEVVGYTDDERAVIESQWDGAIEPELKGGLVEPSAEMLLRLIPDACELVVRRRPIGSAPECGGGRGA